jgi:hypothetical protein
VILGVTQTRTEVGGILEENIWNYRSEKSPYVHGLTGTWNMTEHDKKVNSFLYLV